LSLFSPSTPHVVTKPTSIISHIQSWAHVWRHRIFGRIFGPPQVLFSLPRCIPHLQLPFEACQPCFQGI
jgi:hypothetical protein